MKSLNATIRQIKQQIIDNLDAGFNPIDLQLDEMLESKLMLYISNVNKSNLLILSH